MHGLNWNFMFELHDIDLHDIFHECNHGIKWDLPVLQEIAVTVSTAQYFNILTALLTRDTGTPYLQ
jgi:hypothetical protein